MRIVFIGAVEFSRHALLEAIAAEGEVVGVLTLAPEDATFHSDYADLAEVAEIHRIPVHRVKGTNSRATVDLVKSLKPDVIFVFGWSRLLSAEMLSIPPLGCIGVHPALLPQHRGRHPLIWALVEGLDESGLTFLYLDEGADSGDILWQERFSISLGDDAGTLYAKIKRMASRAIREFLPRLEDGTAPRVPQDPEQATYWRKRGEEDGVIDWSAPTMTTYNLIRALTRPYVGAHTYVNGSKLIVWTALLPRPQAGALPAGAPGTIVAVADEGITVLTGDGELVLSEVHGAETCPFMLGMALGGGA